MSIKILDERVVDQNYNPESENPQSGVAVAEAIKEVDKVYIGTDTMPEGYNIQINPEGSAYELPVTDQTYNPESENAQSGKAVAQAIGKWEKLVDITLTEEVNSIIATAEEFPKIAKCKELLMIASFPKTETELKLGASKAVINDGSICFYSGTTNTSTSHNYEQRARISIIYNEIHSTMTVGATAGLKQAAYMSCGRRFVNGDINQFKYYLDITSMFPIGTQFILYGKVGE